MNIIYADLEMTLINNWDEFEIIPIAKNILDSFVENEIRLFSFAVDNQKDLEIVNSKINFLNEFFGKNFSCDFKVEDLADYYNISVYNTKNKGKEQGFIDYIKFMVIEDSTHDVNFYLIDDMVTESKIVELGNNNKIIFINQWVRQLYA